MLKTWGRLARLSLFPSAVADVTAGLVLGAGVWPTGGAPWCLLLASASVYHGGMLLNDWADRHQDRAVGRDRPLVTGAATPAAVLLVGLALLAAGPLLALGCDSPSLPVYLGLSALVLLYDLGKRGPWLGPLLLSLCRAGNVMAGAIHGAANTTSDALHPSLLGLVALYGLYVFFVSRLGRLEDGEDSRADSPWPRGYLLGAAGALAAGPWIYFLLGDDDLGARHVAAAVLSAAAAWPLARGAIQTSEWTPATILPAMGAALRRLLICSASAALLAPWPLGWITASALLLGYPVSFALRRHFPPS